MNSTKRKKKSAEMEGDMVMVDVGDDDQIERPVVITRSQAEASERRDGDERYGRGVKRRADGLYLRTQEEAEGQPRRSTRLSSRGYNHKNDIKRTDDDMDGEVVLMAGKPGTQQPGAWRVGSGGAPVPELGALHVLVVDPEPKSREKTVDLLKQSGYKVLTCTTGKEAFNLLSRMREENGVDIDVILKAHDPPQSNAVAFLEKMNRKESSADIPVIVYSQSEDRDAVASCLALGAVDYWIKPLRTNEVVNIWTRVWQRKYKSLVQEGKEYFHAGPSSDVSDEAANKAVQSISMAVIPGRKGDSSGSGEATMGIINPEGKLKTTRSSKSISDARAGNAFKLDKEQIEGKEEHKHHHHHHGHHHVSHKAGNVQKVSGKANIKELSTRQSEVARIQEKNVDQSNGSDPSVKSGADPNDVAVAEALTSLRSHRSTHSTGDKIQIDEESKRVNKQDPNSDSGKSKMATPMMPFAFMPGPNQPWNAPINFMPSQYMHPAMLPETWNIAPQDQQLSRKVQHPSDEDEQKTMDMQQAWMNYQQQQYHAMQMNMAAAANALQGSRPPFVGNWAMGGGFGWGSYAPIPFRNPLSKDSSSGETRDSQRSLQHSSKDLRRAALQKYREKKRARNASNASKIRYHSRKVLADARPRVRGKFVQVNSKDGASNMRDTEIETIKNREQKNESTIKERTNQEQTTNLTEQKDLKTESNRRPYAASGRSTALGEWQSSSADGKDIESLGGSQDPSTHVTDAVHASRKGASRGGRSDSGSNSPHCTGQRND